MIKKSLVFTIVMVFLLGSAAVSLAVETMWHGQFRINYYSMSQDKDVDDGVAAARLRWRPTLDVKVNDDVSMHMQLNIGHIQSNSANARFNQDGGPALNCTDADTDTTDIDGHMEYGECAGSGVSGGEPAVGLRHAVLNFSAPEIGGKLSAGLVPLSDKFGDTLFSGDWDFNPLTLAWMGKIENVDIRLAAGKLMETDPAKDDDLDTYLADIDFPIGNGNVGASVYVFRSGDGLTGALGDLGDIATQNYVGVRASQDVGFARVNGFFVYNMGKIESCSDSAFCSSATIGEDVDNSGYAIKLEGTSPVGSANLGLMFIMTSGDKEFMTTDSSSSFITPMALIDHHGYWGYTGKLNVQGPTDTGIDNPLRVDGSVYGGDGLGYGLMTIQAKVDFPVTDKLSGYAAIGIFQHQDVPSPIDESIGTDIYVQGKYNIAENLNLEAGLDYASIGKDNAAYTNTVDNSIILLVARLQLEY